MPEAPKDAFLNDYAERNTTNVILSHMPLLFTPGSFVQNVCVQTLKVKRIHVYTCQLLYAALLSIAGTQRVITASDIYRARTQSNAYKSGHGDGSVERHLGSPAV